MIVDRKRLHFIDAFRAFAILMMLQGHFIDTFLAREYRLKSDFFYSIWSYCRGFTAPVFFTITGFVIFFLLLRQPQKGWKNPRVKKGIKRGFELLIWGFLLRLNLWGLFKGQLYEAFFIPDVLHIIGLSLLLLLGLYTLLSTFKLRSFEWVLIGLSFLIFIYEPSYKTMSFDAWPTLLARMITKDGGGVFYLFPWFGYVAFGAGLAQLFVRTTKKNLWPFVLGCVLFGIFFMHFSSSFFVEINQVLHWNQLDLVLKNNYLFIRLGNTLVLLALFMLLEKWWRSSWFLEIGQRTLSIYIVHYFILFGTWFGLGLKRFLPQNFTPSASIIGAFLFLTTVSLIVLLYYEYLSPIEQKIRKKIGF